MSTAPNASDGLARPIDFEARAGAGLHLGLSLGGGGIFFVAWQVTYLDELAARGVDLRGADRVVGTSAGSLVAAILEAGDLKRFEREVAVFARTPALVSALAPAGELHASQQRALDSFVSARDAEPETIRGIGHQALAARTPSAAKMARSVGLVLLRRKWPAPTLHMTCVDALTGERCVIGASSGVPVVRAVAASSAVPGIFAPQPVLDRRCMDGGVSGSGTHLDLLAGADRVVVLSLYDGSVDGAGGMTQAPHAYRTELARLEASGSKVLVRSPESVDIERLMDPRAVPDAIALARRQAAADADALRSFIA